MCRGQDTEETRMNVLGCFSGALGKGPGFFWEKEFGTIGQETYSWHVVPLIHGWLHMHPKLLLMQDGASGHRAKFTQNELKERDIHPIFWPPYSPDLNPIESIWDWMKDYLQRNYGNPKMNYKQLRNSVQEAWNEVPEDLLESLVGETRSTCTCIGTSKRSWYSPPHRAEPCQYTFHLQILSFPSLQQPIQYWHSICTLYII